jgi:hypothetical protein
LGEKVLQELAISGDGSLGSCRQKGVDLVFPLSSSITIVVVPDHVGDGDFQGLSKGIGKCFFKENSETLVEIKVERGSGK